MCQRKMAEKQVQKNTLSLDGRVKLINYPKKNPSESPKSSGVDERMCTQF